MKINLDDHMNDSNAREFVRILHEHKDDNGEVYIQLPGGRMVKMKLTDYCPLRSIDQPKEVMENRYKHDCEECTFLGQHDEYDLYYCSQGGIPTVIARYSSEGPDYLSGMGMTKIPALQEAEKRAKEKGLIK